MQIKVAQGLPIHQQVHHQRRQQINQAVPQVLAQLHLYNLHLLLLRLALTLFSMLDLAAL
jgi:hypothetical protein